MPRLGRVFFDGAIYHVYNGVPRCEHRAQILGPTLLRPSAFESTSGATAERQGANPESSFLEHHDSSAFRSLVSPSRCLRRSSSCSCGRYRGHCPVTRFPVRVLGDLDGHVYNL